MPPWLQYFLEIITGGPEASTAETLLRGSLIGCSLFAMIQLLTMLGTRWGDRYAMSKSFFLSVLVHLCLGLGWATVVESTRMSAEPPGDPLPVPFRSVLVESSDDVSQPEEGNTPVWQRPLDRPEMELTRSDRQTASVEQQFAPAERTLTAPPLMEVPALASPSMNEPVAAPQRIESAAAPSPLAPAASSPLPAEPVLSARSEAVGTSPTRVAPSRNVESTPVPVTTPQRGGAQRTAPSPDELSLSSELPTDPNPSFPKVVGTPGDAIVRKTSPAAMPIDDPLPGGSSQGASEGSPATGNTAGGPRFTRSGNRPRAEVADSSLPSTGTGSRAGTDSNRERAALVRKPTAIGADDSEDGPVPGFVRPAPANLGTGKRPAQAATTYKLRRLERRPEIALRNGGSRESERAVEAALAWLSRTQEPEGFWDADRHGGGAQETRNIDAGKPAGGKETDTGITGLAILSFLGAGYTHEEGDYTETVSKAIRWVIDQQRGDGYLGGSATYYDQMYCHGIATYALAEAYGMQNDPTQFRELREAVTRGVWYITQTQNTDGGWRYRVGASASDMSMFGWQLMALRSAELAGIETPPECRKGMLQFLRERSRGNQNGLAGYKLEDGPSPAMTAEALFCKQMFGLKRSNPASQEALDYLGRNLPNLTAPNEYYWYYGTLAMFQFGGEPWNQWNAAMRDTIVRLQRHNGEGNGSWDPVGPWGSVGGRVYSTAVNTLCLEVYYRFLPLYRSVGE